jgi:cytochrome c oxidase subunit 2
MRLGRLSVRYVLFAALLLLGALLFSGCGVFSSPQNTFAPEGEVAKLQRDLFVIVMIPALLIMIGVFAAILYIVVRFRRRSESDPIPEQVHGNTRLELTWTILPTILLIGIAVPTLWGIIKLGETPGAEALHVTVIGSQWQWNYEYTDPEFLDADGNPLLTTEFYVPVDRDVALEIEAADVLHSFWIPKIAGKTDAVPGRTNRMWIKADSPGTYAGQCAEFCGIRHPQMKAELIAVEPAEFEAWAQEQMSGGPGEGAPDEGGSPGGPEGPGPTASP